MMNLLITDPDLLYLIKWSLSIGATVALCGLLSDWIERKTDKRN
jgi:hypothetical protein